MICICDIYVIYIIYIYLYDIYIDILKTSHITYMIYIFDEFLAFRILRCTSCAAFHSPLWGERRLGPSPRPAILGRQDAVPPAFRNEMRRIRPNLTWNSWSRHWSFWSTRHINWVVICCLRIVLTTLLNLSAEVGHDSGTSFLQQYLHPQNLFITRPGKQAPKGLRTYTMF